MVGNGGRFPGCSQILNEVNDLTNRTREHFGHFDYQLMLSCRENMEIIGRIFRLIFIPWFSKSFALMCKCINLGLGMKIVLFSDLHQKVL